MADYFWCKLAVQRGWSVEETANKLLEVNAKGRNARGSSTKATH